MGQLLRLHPGDPRPRQSEGAPAAAERLPGATPLPLAELLQSEIAERLARTQMSFAVRRNGADLLVPGHRPIRWSAAGAKALDARIGTVLRLYEETTTIVLSYLIDRFRASMFFDVGAGVGYFARVAAAHAGTPVTVHAFEMRPDRFGELKDNAARDAGGERIAAHLAGITEAHAGEREVWFARGMLFEERPQPSEYREAWWRRVKFALRGNTGRDLESARLLITSIDHFAQDKNVRPDILKIDVEGYEGRVLRGARRTLAEHRPFVLLELHKDKKLRFGAHREDVAQLLFDLGYQGLFFTDHQKRRACEVVETGRGCPLLLRQETDLILFFHRDYRGGAGASPAGPKRPTA